MQRRNVIGFFQVRIDPGFQTLVWPNDAEWDPTALHDWPEHVEELARRTRQWALVAVAV